ncbi:MAG: UDP-N-acetylmuramate dehydrogenase [Acidimicrobiales bacterium]
MTDDLAAAVDALRAGPLAARLEIDAPIGARTTYRVGGHAAALVTLESFDDVDALAEVLRGRDVAALALGRGSNLLVSDDGFAGIAIVLGNGFAAIEIDTSATGTGSDPAALVVCGAAAKLPVVARTTVQAGLTGFEWAVGVPGSVGGAVRMNAGGHGAEMADSLVDAEVLDLRTGSLAVRSRAELDFGYRRAAVRPWDLVLRARLGLDEGDAAAGKAQMLEIVQWRRDHQPGGQNAGSVFSNPEGDSAGRLIDAAGLKGLRIGTAEVSEKHANFIQADADGRAADVRAVMLAIQRVVLDRHGVALQPETHLVGFPDDGAAHHGD